MRKTDIVAVIPARGGSKGIPRKNLRLVCGKPLIAHTILAAKKSQRIGRIIVSTDDLEIGTIATQFGAEVICRPDDISGLVNPKRTHSYAAFIASNSAGDI